MSNGLPDGFGSTKKLKRRKDMHDRKLIKTLSKQAVEKLLMAKDLVAEFYRKHRTPPVCPWFFWMDPLVFTR
jgi:hypothetical protein